MATSPQDILALPVVTLRDWLASGALRATELADALIARIAEVEPHVGAFAWFDPGFLRAQAEQADRHRQSGRPIGPLHGLPIGLKDVIDTKGIPTENGTVLAGGRMPAADATVVARLRAAGGLVLGKTTTTELQFLHPSATRNPANPEHTPGGSSAGSAAAVAAGMAPLAVGTQTGGSVIRPASFCGCVGFKPSFGAIPRRGILTQSPSLDTVGVFARDVEAAALLAEVLMGTDPADPQAQPMPPPALLATTMADVPVVPTFAFVDLPGFSDAHPDLRNAMADLVERLGEQAWSTPLPRLFNDAAATRGRINDVEMAHHYRGYASRGWDRLSPQTRDAIERGRTVSAPDYLASLETRGVLAAGLDEILTRCDAILVPAAPGPAPQGLHSTGDSIFNGLFTFTGHPAVTLPLFTDTAGMPMGLQLVGRRGEDGRLLRTARWLHHRSASADRHATGEHDV
ncbi:amidase [Paracoccus sp. AK26]|uniref:amidase n=1 Tax=Paracoccus sp. AK26 TaxID=2589076 RepID=UPI0014282644|nr:amidase [Paracoccus sp. AK26]QIR85217.1 amidase [Paracoccus sp. AK26]